MWRALVGGEGATTPHAFATVEEIFRPLYGNNWWAEVSTFAHFNEIVVGPPLDVEARQARLHP
jgi:hypothetical protein